MSNKDVIGGPREGDAHAEIGRPFQQGLFKFRDNVRADHGMQKVAHELRSELWLDSIVRICPAAL